VGENVTAPTPQYILSLSYGKDSLACLGAIEELGWPLDRIIHAEVWATDTIPADLPPMMEFKAKADAVIKEQWGIEVEHVRGPYTYEQVLKRRAKSAIMERYTDGLAWSVRGVIRNLKQEH